MIIGICGQAGSGKDTVADFLVKHHGFVKVAFADPMKRISRDVFAFTDEQLWGPSERRNAPDIRYPRPREEAEFLTAETFLTPRHALQQLGSEWGRACYKDVWVEYAMRTAKEILERHRYYSARGGLAPTDIGADGYYDPMGGGAPRGVVISDVRFRNEVEGIRRGGGKTVRITRPQAGLAGTAGAHGSETEQLTIPDELFDFHIKNEETLDELERVTATMVAWLHDTGAA